MTLQPTIALPRLTLFARLTIVSGLFLLVSSSLFAWILVKNDLRSLQEKCDASVQQHKIDIASIITEKAIVGDYAAIEQYFRSLIKPDDIYSLRWVDRHGNVVEASLKPVTSAAPVWFQNWTDLKSSTESSEIEAGGSSYGTYTFKQTALDGVDAVWHSLTIQFRLMFLAFIACMTTALLLLKQSLLPLGDLAAAANRFGEGDHSARVPLTRVPDMQQSVQAFNKMAGTIETLLQQQIDHEKLLLKSESRLKEAQRIAMIGCWEFEHASGLIYCSEEIYRIVERHPEQCDASFEGFINLVHPDDRETVLATFTSSLAQRILCSVTCRLQAPENRIKHVQWQFETNFDEAGNPLLSLGTIQDVTSRKDDEAEKQNLMAQLSHSQKIESVGRLAAGIAHDFNNLLTPIIGYAEMLKMTTPPDSCDVAKFNNILLAADKAKILTQQLLSFGRKQILEMKIIDLNEVVTSFYEILRRTIRENIEFQLHLAGDLPGIKADRNQLIQVIMNLTVNAQDAIAGTGVITIETAPVLLDEEYAQQHADLAPGRYLMLAVSDNGSGMDQETLARLFEPFYTTKALGKGTGLGLSMVYGLVKQHEGSIRVSSEIGKGSDFRIYFPVAGEVAGTDPETASPQLALSAGGRTILLVEDDEMVRSVVKELFHNHGFNVIEAEGPKQALAIAEGRQVDLLVTDVVMPDMNGLDLHRCLLESHPGLKVLFMSGYTNNVIDNEGILAGGINFIQKPFAGNELALKVETLMNIPPAS